MNPSRNIDELLSDIVTLPSMPATISHVLSMLENPDSSLKEVGQLLSADPSIAMKTLRLVNSAYYGLSQKVKSVEHAVAMLGQKVVRNLVLTATVFEQVKGGSEAFVRHSICVGVATEMSIGQSRSVNIPADEAFIYGVLHDVGKIIFMEYLPEEWGQARQLAKEQAMPLYQAERTVIGVDHADLGARLSKHWKLPDEVTSIIAGHHDLSRCSEATRPAAAVLNVANYMATTAGFGSPMEGTTPFNNEAWKVAGLRTAVIPSVLDRFFKGLSAVDELVSAIT